MKTIQGKDFNYSDILLFNIIGNQIIAIVNDKEQLEKFKYSGLITDAPIYKVDYSDEIVSEIIRNMKKIKEYRKNDSFIEIIYKDGTNTKVALESEEIVKNNLEAQREFSKEVIVSNLGNLTEEEKKNKKKEASKKWKRGLATILAALAVYSAAANKDKIASALAKKEETKDPINPIQTEEVIDKNNSNQENQKTNELVTKNVEIPPLTLKDLDYYVEVDMYDFTKLGKQLHKETVDKNNFVLKYQQIVNIDWNEELAKMVVEVMNGFYPNEMLNMNDEDAYAKMTEVLQALSLITAGNLNTETDPKDIVNIENYFLRTKDSVIAHNAMVVARYSADESVGEPMNGKILDENDYASVDKFSREYLGSVDQLLHYEYETLNDPMFQQMSSGAKWYIANIFWNINSCIPQWDKIEKDGKTIYYRDFINTATHDLYYPVIGPNGTVDYISTQTGTRYNMFEMFAKAGIQITEEQRNVEMYADPDIQMEGIGLDVDNTVKDEQDDLYDLRFIVQEHLQKNGKGAK